MIDVEKPGECEKTERSREMLRKRMWNGAKVCKSAFSVLYIFTISFSISVLFSKRRISANLVKLENTERNFEPDALYTESASIFRSARR